MADPDELYTLRAQFALGHYTSALQEAKQVSRRPLSASLQAERDEYTVRAHTALRHYDKIEPGDRPGRFSIMNGFHFVSFSYPERFSTPGIGSQSQI